MPGIVGLITKKPRAWAESQVALMLQAIHHEPFYETGTHAEESVGVYAGWTALKDSFSAHMPLHNERGDITLIFSGEEYSSLASTQALRQRGHSLNGHPASYLVHLSEEDPRWLNEMNGLFHGLLIDRNNRTATVFNDRYGMHRLYFHQAQGTFYFAAESKAILAVCPELRTANLQSLGEFVACSCVLEDRTIFPAIHALPGASAWTFREGLLDRKHSYFSPGDWENQQLLEAEPFVQELREVLTRNLPAYFNGEGQKGIALTGGMDTRLILACHRPTPGTLASYTFGGMFRESEDVRIARQIADLCQQPYQVITVGDEFLAQFPHYAERTIYLTEGAVDVYRSSDLYVSEKARSIAPIKIVGTYGSEIIRRAVMFKPMPVSSALYAKDFLPYVDKAAQTYQFLRRQHPVTFAAFRQSPWYHHGILALEQSQFTVRSPYLDNDFVKTAFRMPNGSDTIGDVRFRLIQECGPDLAKIPTDRGIGGNRSDFMAAIAHAWMEFTFKAEYAYDYGMPQWMTRIDRQLAAFHPERLFLGRHKLLHYRVWYRDVLAKYVQEILLDKRTLTRPHLNPQAVEMTVLEHVQGKRNHTTEIHKLLTLELMHRLFLDS